MDEIIPRLWIGDLASALDDELLRSHHINSICSILAGELTISPNFEHLHIDLEDSEHADALSEFPRCLKWLKSSLDSERGVLVHCQAGQSRSPTFVAAFLMLTENLDVSTALERIRRVRPCIWYAKPLTCHARVWLPHDSVPSPNDGFLKQLNIFFQASCSVSRTDKETRLFYIQTSSREQLLSPTILSPILPGSLNSVEEEKAPFAIRCRLCRRELAGKHNLMHSLISRSLPTAPNSNGHDDSFVSRGETQSCSGYFLEPMEWMEAFLSNGCVSGRIICPNLHCKAKLGNFNWSGQMCGCTEWVTPAFHVARSKVDYL